MTISINSRPRSEFARYSRSFSQSSFRPSARTELTTLDSSTKTSTRCVRIGLQCLPSFARRNWKINWSEANHHKFLEIYDESWTEKCGHVFPARRYLPREAGVRMVDFCPTTTRVRLFRAGLVCRMGNQNSLPP